MCFGCAPNNPMGLHMEFFEDGDDIVAFWKPKDVYQGWLRTDRKSTRLNSSHKRSSRMPSSA